MNEEGEGCVCVPGSGLPCYSGPAGTEGVGACAAGTLLCNEEGTGYGPCQGEVLPAPETCANATDDDCDGALNEEGADCLCVPGTSAPCYPGPAGTENVGNCRAGSQVCTVKTFGYNFYGQLGNNTTTNSTAPVTALPP